jgi:hypothetical protein
VIGAHGAGMKLLAFVLVVLSVGVVGLGASPATAERALDLTARAGGTKQGLAAGAQVGYGTATLAGLLDVAVLRGSWFVRGLPTDDVTVADVRAGARWTVAERGHGAFELSGLGGVRRIGGADAVLAAAFELGAGAVIRPRPGLSARLGLAVPVVITEDGEVDQLDQRLHAGVEVAVADAVALTADAFAGGAYGYDGDGAKLAVGALLGVRVAARERSTASSGGGGGGGRGSATPVVFVATEYRALGVAGHYSHGLGYAVGAALLGGRLRIGIAGFNRPGPLNPATFAATPVDGQMWNGQRELALRSDGNFVGLHVAPAFRVGRVRFTAPITIGQAAFGFYLHGADRAAVTGERVSDVENRLFAGKDSSFGLGVEVGATAAVPITAWLSAYASVHYLATLGFAALDRDDYAGPSAALGIELGL